MYQRIKSGNLFRVLEGDIGISQKGEISKGKQSFVFLDENTNKLSYTGPVYGADLLLMFELPSGSYASVFVWWIDRKVGEVIE